MHIVFVDTTITTPPTGGAHTFLVDLCVRLTGQSYRVSVITQLGPDENLLKTMEAGGVEIQSNIWRPSHLPEERASLLAEWVRGHDVDVYVVSASPDVGWLTLPLIDPEIPTLSIAHNDNKAFYEPLYHYHQFVDIAIAVSSEIERKILAAGVPAERVRQIPYGTEPVSEAEINARVEAGRTNPPVLNIGYVGRVVQEQKRVFEFAPLLVRLKSLDVSFQFHIIGDGSDRQQLGELFAASGVDGSVKFWGWQSPEGVAKLLGDLDVFLLMSDYEGLPVALLEAMGHGLAPIVSRIPSGNSQLIDDGENGFLAEVGDIGGFASRIEALAGDLDRLRKIQNAAWKTSQDYTVSRMVDRYLRCFDDARSRGLSRNYRRQVGGAYPPMPSCVSRYPFWMRKIKYQFQTWKTGSLPL
jgi:glycosyltransferase involved in cell wall biosynthesis